MADGTVHSIRERRQNTLQELGRFAVAALDEWESPVLPKALARWIHPMPSVPLGADGGSLPLQLPRVLHSPRTVALLSFGGGPK